MTNSFSLVVDEMLRNIWFNSSTFSDVKSSSSIGLTNSSVVWRDTSIKLKIFFEEMLLHSRKLSNVLLQYVVGGNNMLNKRNEICRKFLYVWEAIIIWYFKVPKSVHSSKFYGVFATLFHRQTCFAERLENVLKFERWWHENKAGKFALQEFETYSEKVMIFFEIKRCNKVDSWEEWTKTFVCFDCNSAMSCRWWKRDKLLHYYWYLRIK